VATDGKSIVQADNAVHIFKIGITDFGRELNEESESFIVFSGFDIFELLSFWMCEVYSPRTILRVCRWLFDAVMIILVILTSIEKSTSLIVFLSKRKTITIYGY
jgi:hypothetical protein